MLDYDFIVLGMAIALLASYGLDCGFKPWDKTLLALAWFMPPVARPIARTIYLPIGLLTLVALFVVRTRDTPDCVTAKRPATAV